MLGRKDELYHPLYLQQWTGKVPARRVLELLLAFTLPKIDDLYDQPAQILVGPSSLTRLLSKPIWACLHTLIVYIK